MSKDNIKHEIVMNRLLSEILDDKYLSVNAFFKGGTCAKMLGYLDRFSVDLDFDLSEGADRDLFRQKLKKIFENLNLEIKDHLPAPRSNTFFVYAIACEGGSLYIGHTNNLQKRWQEHLSGKGSQWTKKYLPLEVAYYEERTTKEQAIAREKELKTGFGRKWLKREICAFRARQAGSKKSLQFFLKYPAEKGFRNTLKLEILDNFYNSNIYRPFHLPDIERTATCQTIETMFSHKLIAPLDRKEKGGSVAGRDIYDIHYFFSQGYEYLPEIIKERRGVALLEHFSDLKDFVEKEVTKQMIDEDLNALLDYDKFKMIRKYLKEETLRFIEKEIGSFKD